MEELIPFETEDMCVYCDNLAVKYGCCEYHSYLLKQCPDCLEYALDDVVCIECGNAYIFVNDDFYVTIERVETVIKTELKYYKFVNRHTNEHINVQFDKELTAGFTDLDFSFDPEFLEGINLSDFYKAIGLCYEDSINQ